MELTENFPCLCHVVFNYWGNWEISAWGGVQFYNIYVKFLKNWECKHKYRQHGSHINLLVFVLRLNRNYRIRFWSYCLSPNKQYLCYDLHYALIVYTIKRGINTCLYCGFVVVYDFQEVGCHNSVANLA